MFRLSFSVYQGLHLAKDAICWILLWRRQWHPTPVLLPGKSHGQRTLVGCSPWGLEELDTTKRLHFHFSLSYIGERNGNPLQCSCLENPRDVGAWWAAVYGVAQSQTRLKRLSSSSSRILLSVSRTELCHVCLTASSIFWEIIRYSIYNILSYSLLSRTGFPVWESSYGVMDK